MSCFSAIVVACDVVEGKGRRGKVIGGLKEGKAVDSQQAGYQRGRVKEGRDEREKGGKKKTRKGVCTEEPEKKGGRVGYL
jgi:hypothetical protein